MALFKDHNLLFIHIPKNAGKSIEAALGLREPLSELGRRNWLNRLCRYGLRKSENPDTARVLHGSLDYTLCAQHLTLQEIELLGLVPDMEAGRLRMFAVCRNPWDRAVSTYKHFSDSRTLEPSQFESFCKTFYSSPSCDHNILAHKRSQLDFIRKRTGQVGVHRILRFEHLDEDFNALCRDFNLGEHTLPHIGKQGQRTAYRELYTEAAQEMVAKRFADDIREFGYGF